MVNRVLAIIILVFSGLILINLLFLDFQFLKSERPARQPATVPFSPLPAPTPADGKLADTCGPICQQMIAEKIAQVKETTVKEKIVSATPQPQVIYIPLGGGGTTTNTSWSDVGNTGVYIDLKDYPALKKAYFEGFIKVKHGNGKAYARLYDATHGIGVQGSEIETTAENFTLVESGNITLWQGKNLYRIQIKSLNGYEAALDSSRVKIII